MNFVVKLRQNWLSLQLFVLQADATRSFAWGKMQTGLLIRVGASCDFGLPLVRWVTGRALLPALFGVTLEPVHQTRFLNFTSRGSFENDYAFFFGHLKTISIRGAKRIGYQEGCSFVPVNERMVSNQPPSVSNGQIRYRRLGFSIGEKLHWPRQSRF